MGAQNGKIMGPKLFAPPPSRQGKTFRAPPFKEWKLFAPPPYNMAKTSSYCIKTTPKLFAPPPLQHGLNPPPHLPLCSPPPPLSVISDQSLKPFQPPPLFFVRVKPDVPPFHFSPPPSL